MIVRVTPLGPEQAFRLEQLEVREAGMSGAMATGPWLADRYGTPVVGSLGVLVDDVLGTALIRGRAEGRWSVSSEITIDLVGDLRYDGQLLHSATTTPPQLDGLGGHVSGTVTTAAGDVVAVCSQRGRWVPFVESDPVPTPPELDFSGASCVEDLLGGAPSAVEGGAVLSLVVGPALANPLGNLHGGLSLCASDLVAATAVTTWDAPWLTESLRIQYVRPVPAGADITFTAQVRHAGRTRAVVDVTGSVAGRTCTLAHVSGRPLTG